MFIRYFLLLILAVSFIYSPIALSGTLDDFESSTGSSSSSSSGGCGSTYDDGPYYSRPRPYPVSSTGPSKTTGMQKIRNKYLDEPIKAPEPKTTTEGDKAPQLEDYSQPASTCSTSGLYWPKFSCLNDLKKAGYPAIPTVRFRGSYQKLTTDIQGYNLNLEAGHGMFALEVDYINYFETNPKDKLYIVTPRALIRLPSTYYELDLGIGATILKGDRRNTGTNIGLAFYLFPIKELIFDSKLYATAFSGKKSMIDYDIGVSYKYKMIGARAGYRVLWTEGNKTLQGPHFGIFAQW